MQMTARIHRRPLRWTAAGAALACSLVGLSTAAPATVPPAQTLGVSRTCTSEFVESGATTTADSVSNLTIGPWSHVDLATLPVPGFEPLVASCGSNSDVTLTGGFAELHVTSANPASKGNKAKAHATLQVLLAVNSPTTVHLSGVVASHSDPRQGEDVAFVRLTDLFSGIELLSEATTSRNFPLDPPLNTAPEPVEFDITLDLSPGWYRIDADALSTSKDFIDPDVGTSSVSLVWTVG